MMLEISRDILIKMYQDMVRIRAFEEKTVELFTRGVLPGFLHSSIGQEAVAAGTCSNLREDDYISSTHRGHGHVIAKGMRLDRMMAEIYGKRDGYCKGKGGSMHIADMDIGILGANGIVSGGIPIVNGAALAFKLRKTDQVAVCFFGDGASNEGNFHEGLNLASVWALPVIFVCENNLYAESTPQREHQKVKDISVRAKAYNIPGVSIDGNDVTAVYLTVNDAVKRARQGEGPALIECKTYRHLGHYVGDSGELYRTKEEVEIWKKRDPLVLFQQKLLDSGQSSQDEITRMERKIEKEIDEAVKFAEASPEPDLAEALEDIYVS